MVASVVMLIGLLGLAVFKSRPCGQTTSATDGPASLLAQDLVQNMQLWQYGDARLSPQASASPAHTGSYTDTNHADVARFWELQNSAALVSTLDGTSLAFDYTDCAAGAAQINQLSANYGGVLSRWTARFPRRADGVPALLERVPGRPHQLRDSARQARAGGGALEGTQVRVPPGEHELLQVRSVGFNL